MKQYRTLVFGEVFDNRSQEFEEYLRVNNIQYLRTADFATELRKFGYKKQPINFPIDLILVNVFTILVEGDDMTAISLVFDDTCVIRNTWDLKLKNIIRRIFTW